MYNTKMALEIAKRKIITAHDIIWAQRQQNRIEFYGSKPYLATTQNLSYLNYLKEGCSFDNCFTILGSGDTIFELTFLGAKNITAVDNNDFQLDVFYLRKAAIKGLSYDEFYSFLVDTKGEGFLNYDVFMKKVYPYFETGEEIPAGFWEIILEEESPKMLASKFFKGALERVSFDLYKESVSYLKKQRNYEKMKESLKDVKINIIKDDAIEYLEKTDKTFSFVDISNTLIYYFQKLECNHTAFLNKCYKLYEIKEKKLDANGIFVLDYIFGLGKKELSNSMYYSGSEPEEVFVLEIYKETYSNLLDCYKEKLKILEVREVCDALPLKGIVDSVIYC